jgi:hypothetical protein
VKAGGIRAESRTGEKCFFPMTSLSVGLVSPMTTAHCQSHVDIADLASESKKMAKKIDGNSYFVNHRQSPKTLESIQAVNDNNVDFHEQHSNGTVVKLHAMH